MEGTHYILGASSLLTENAGWSSSNKQHNGKKEHSVNQGIPASLRVGNGREAWRGRVSRRSRVPWQVSAGPTTLDSYSLNRLW